MTEDLNHNPADEIMCSCSGTTRGMIYDLVMQGKDVEAISRYSGALSGCGGCEYEICQFVQALTTPE
jgi:bacterioferritin-associated ferredoxin